MGEIVVDIELENVKDRGLARAGHLRDTDIRRATIPAVADTGVIMLALPEDVVSQIGARPAGSVNATYADGRRGELPVAGPLIVRIGDRWMPTNCIVLPQGAAALIGQIVTRQLDLVADHVAQTLHPRPAAGISPSTAPKPLHASLSPIPTHNHPNTPHHPPSPIQSLPPSRGETKRGVGRTEPAPSGRVSTRSPPQPPPARSHQPPPALPPIPTPHTPPPQFNLSLLPGGRLGAVHT